MNRGATGDANDTGASGQIGREPATLFNKTVRDAGELLPRYEVDNLFVSEKFKSRFPNFQVTSFREGLTEIRRESKGS